MLSQEKSMAEPKNPYNNIDKELTLVGNPIFDDEPVDFVMEEQEGDPNLMEITELEDWYVELGSPEQEVQETGFMSNLA